MSGENGEQKVLVVSPPGIETKGVEEIRKEIVSMIEAREQQVGILETQLNTLRAEIAQLELLLIPAGEKSAGTNIGFYVLSPRERQILSMVVRGSSNKGIAGGLDISETTVKAHLRAILQKTHSHNRAEAASKYARVKSE